MLVDKLVRPWKRQSLVACATHNLHWEARLATDLLERWGMIAAKPNGEDSSGRSKVDLMTPEELVERACTTARLAVETFEKLGWIEEVEIQDDEENDNAM